MALPSFAMIWVVAVGVMMALLSIAMICVGGGILGRGTPELLLHEAGECDHCCGIVIVTLHHQI